MTAVLKVQGVELDVSVADWEPVRLGQVARSLSGRVRSSVRATKRDHHFHGDVGGMTVATAELVRALVEGEGHHWSFDDTSSVPTSLFISSRGLTAYSYAGSETDIVGKYSGGLQADFTEAPVKWAIGFDGNENTLLYWREESAVWVHYVVRRTGAGPTVSTWRNGVASTDPGGVYVTAGGELWIDPATETQRLDELVALPFAVPSAWVAGLYAFHAAQAWAPLPYVTAEGAAFPGGATQCLGQVGTAQRVPFWSGGTFTLGEAVDFTLQER